MVHNKFLTTREVADFLHVSEKAVYGLVSEKGLPASKVTGKWIFPKKLVEEWVETHVTGFRGNYSSPSSESGALLIAGSDDPLFQRALSLFHASSSESMAFFANVGSMGGINYLRRGVCHIGVCHLLQDDEKEYNFEYALRELQSVPVIVNFSKREQGFLVARGNPKKIRGIEDFAREDVSIVNRPLGTGTRLLLDLEISHSDVTARSIAGYDREVAKHIDAGLEVLAGRADAAPAIRAVAGMLNLDFISLRWERFDLLINRERFFEKGIQTFLGMLHDESFQKAASSLQGYDMSLCGKMVFPENLKNEERL